MPAPKSTVECEEAERGVFITLEEHKKPMLPLLILSPYQHAERIPTKKAAEQQEMFG